MIFNFRLLRVRRVVENAFGILASVFSKFGRPIIADVENIVVVTKTCIALHNFLIKTQSRKGSHPKTMFIFSYFPRRPLLSWCPYKFFISDSICSDIL